MLDFIVKLNKKENFIYLLFFTLILFFLGKLISNFFSINYLYFQFIMFLIYTSILILGVIFDGEKNKLSRAISLIVLYLFLLYINL